MPQANSLSITPAPQRALSPTKRKRIENRIEELIAVLDAADPDPDLEPSLCCGCGDDREGDTCRRRAFARLDGERPMGRFR